MSFGTFHDRNWINGRKRNVSEYLENPPERNNYQKWFKQANGGSRLQFFQADFERFGGDPSVFPASSNNMNLFNRRPVGGAGNYAGGTGNYSGGVGSYSGGASNYARGASNYAGRVNSYAGGARNYVGGARNYAGGAGNYAGGAGNYAGGVTTNRVERSDNPAKTRQDMGGAGENVGGTNTKSEEDSDPPLPKELLIQFQPLFCKLCSLQMTSNVMSTMHYKSKNHEKKIRKFLLDYAAERGEEPHPRATRTRQNDTKEEKDPRHFHCDVCDLPLHGKLHAESHYMGKPHNAVVMGKRLPSGRGRYDVETGKWKRDTQEKLKYDGVNDNFGLAFRTPQNNETQSMESETSSKSGMKDPIKCTICQVFCTGQEQMTMHLNGTKHRKKLKSMGVSPEDIGLDEVKSGPDALAETSSTDFSKYKTPSGSFYCQKCNLTLNSDLQLQQHLNSKNHAKKSN